MLLQIFKEFHALLSKNPAKILSQIMLDRKSKYLE